MKNSGLKDCLKDVIASVLVNKAKNPSKVKRVIVNLKKKQEI